MTIIQQFRENGLHFTKILYCCVTKKPTYNNGETGILAGHAYYNQIT
jgi:hypothetical protein